MTDPSAWPKPAKLEDEDNSLALVTVLVTLLLSQIASYTERALKDSLYLQTGITYEALVRCFGENQSLKPTDYKTTVNLQASQDLHKIPTFHIPRFQGDTLIGDDFTADVDRAFWSAAIDQFLDS